MNWRFWQRWRARCSFTHATKYPHPSKGFVWVGAWLASCEFCANREGLTLLRSRKEPTNL